MNILQLCYSCSVTIYVTLTKHTYFHRISGGVYSDDKSELFFNTILCLFRCAINPCWPICYLFRWSLSNLTCCCSSNSQQLLQHSRWWYSLICPPFICSLTCAYKDTNVELHDCTNEAYTLLAHLYIRTLIQTYTNIFEQNFYKHKNVLLKVPDVVILCWSDACPHCPAHTQMYI